MTNRPSTQSAAVTLGFILLSTAAWGQPPRDKGDSSAPTPSFQPGLADDEITAGRFFVDTPALHNLGFDGEATSRLVLVEDGNSRAPIVVFEDAPPYTRRAADELAEYIEKTSGAKPQVIEGEPQPLPERAIWVGLQPKVAELFPDLDFHFKHPEFHFKHPEEILIAANENHLVIAGRDRWDPDHLEVEGINEKITSRARSTGISTVSSGRHCPITT